MNLNTPLSKLLFLSFLMPAFAWGQNAQIKGRVIDAASEAPLIGASVRLMTDGQIRAGAYVDEQGAYQLQAGAGTYIMIASFAQYEADTSEIVLEAGQELVKNIQLQEKTLNTVLIVGKKDLGSSTSEITTKFQAISSVDGVSAELLGRTGDNTVASALARVTGVSVEGGKYVYVRGLGDRYSTTLVNGAAIPNLDPNRNAVQMDIFPSSMVDNISVFKTFTPDLPGNFTGGLINVVTKAIPESFSLNFSASMSFNPQVNLRDDFLSQENGSLDWLGMDDGSRALPSYVEALSEGIPEFTTNDQDQATIIQEATNSFQSDMEPLRTNSFLNQNYQFSFGDSYSIGKKRLGVFTALSYRNTYSSYQNGESNRWKTTGGAATSLNANILLKDEQSSQNVLWAGLAGLSLSLSDESSISFLYMHNQSGNSQARMLEGEIPQDDPDLIFQTRVLGYQERALDAFQLRGTHKIGAGELNWISSRTFSRQDEPDLRFFSNDYETQGENRVYSIQESIYPAPNRFYRELREQNWDTRIDYELPIDLSKGTNPRQLVLKFGGALTYKQRDFNEDRYEYTLGSKHQRYNGDADAFFNPNNYGVTFDTVFGFPVINYRLYIADASEARNDYSASMMIPAAFAMANLPLTDRLDMMVGARYEGSFGETVSGDENIAKGELNTNDILPAVSFKYAKKNMTKLSKMNLRAGYSRTLARPSFREFAPFTSFDFIGDYLLRGNPELDRTLIDNFDLRWELAPSPSELYSISFFFKDFHNPIEKVLVPESAGNAPELYFANVSRGTAYGVEIEVRKNLGFITPALSNFQIGGNVSLLNSWVNIDSAEYAAIVEIDPERASTRPMYGQSPYTINGELAYIDPDLGIKASLSYNLFGPRIVVVGGKSAPDVYEQARGLLNFSFSKSVGERFDVQLRANNLLDPEYRQTHTFRGQEYVFQSYQVGRSFSLGIKVHL
ncbi:MAG: TonB-dependent receptor plug domain-containing protein [Bacteroidia bacterium]